MEADREPMTITPQVWRLRGVMELQYCDRVALLCASGERVCHEQRHKHR
jgi:hypothetical protein